MLSYMCKSFCSLKVKAISNLIMNNPKQLESEVALEVKIPFMPSPFSLQVIQIGHDLGVIRSHRLIFEGFEPSVILKFPDFS